MVEKKIEVLAARISVMTRNPNPGEPPLEQTISVDGEKALGVLCGTHKIVPKEPTEEMIIKGIKSLCDMGPRLNRMEVEEKIVELYKAMTESK